MHNYQELKIWQKGMDLATETYQITQKFPAEEKFGLISQMRRCAVSIPSNIAEGAAFDSDNQFLHFLSISNGSCNELLTQSIIAQRIGFLTQDEQKLFSDKITEIQKMNFTLRNNLKKKQK